MVRVPCFRGSFANEGAVQNHRESMRSLQGEHAFAVTDLGPRFCKAAAKAWHPNLFIICEKKD
jgi:hypothetical protein